MIRFARCLLCLLVSVTAAMAADAPRVSGYKAVLIAGDPSAPAFDNATAAMRQHLLASGVAPADIEQFSANPLAVGRDGVESSTLGHVLAAIARMHPAAGQGCFVFATSHGAYQKGLVMAPSENFLTPAALDRALRVGCGDAPTVAIISGCFSGSFTQPPMARPNRVVLSAARQDRPSFGCGTEFHYNVYDDCLLHTMHQAGTWKAAYALIAGCVAGRERELRFPASGPRAWFGDGLSRLPLPGRG